MSYIYSDVTFDDRALASISGVRVLSINPYLPAKRNLSLDELARSNDNKMSSSFYKRKSIAVKVSLNSTNRRSTEQILDSLLAILQGEEKYLKVPQSGGYRRYLCTYSDYDVGNQGGSHIELNLIFLCSRNFGFDIERTVLLANSSTSAITSDNITLDGSAPWQAPRYTYNFTSITGGTAKTVSIGNASTGQQIDITRDWVTGDVLIVDCLEHTVQVNGVDVDFTGAFPEFEKGVQQTYYQDNFTARTRQNLVDYYKRWV